MPKRKRLFTVGTRRQIGKFQGVGTRPVSGGYKRKRTLILGARKGKKR